MTDGLTISTTVTDDALVLVVEGDLDAATSPQLEGEVRAGLFTSALADVVVDLSGVTFLDSTGLGAIVALHRSVRERDGVLIVRRPSPTVARLLDVTRLTGELKVEE